MKNTFLLLLIAVLFNGLTASAQTWVWGANGGPGQKSYQEGGGVATNRTGNVYRCGGFGGTYTFGSANLTGSTTISSMTADAYLVKYDQNGNLLWARQSIGNEATVYGQYSPYTVAWSVASDDSDNAYITGSYNDSSEIFDHDTLFDAYDASDYGTGSGYQIPLTFLVKYNHNGNVVWAKSSGNVTETGLSVATDKFKHEYVTGMTTSVYGPLSNGTYAVIGGDQFFRYRAFLTKYDRNGNVVWTVKPDTFVISPDTNASVGNSVTTDISGNVYVAGQFQDSLVFGNYKLYSTNPAVFIAKFDSNGNVLWVQQSTNNLATGMPLHERFGAGIFENSPDPVRGGYSVATDMSGAVYLTGPFVISTTFGSYNFTVKRNNRYDFFLVKYNPGGTIAWGEQATPLDDSSSWVSSSISSDDSNRIYIVGIDNGDSLVQGGNYAQKGSFAFGKGTFTSVVSYSNVSKGTYPNGDGKPAFLLKLDSSGVAICGSTVANGGFLGDEDGITNGVLNLTLSVASDSTGKFVYMGGPFAGNLVLGPDTLVYGAPQLGGGGFYYDEEPYTARWQGCECNLVISGTPLQTICSGYTAILTASGATSYTWSPAATLSSSTGDSVVADPVVTTTYTISGINSFTGCKATVIDTIYVLEGVNIPLIDTVGNVLISSSTNDNRWFRNDSILPGQTGRTDTATVSGWYKVEAINPSNGCNTVSDSIYITVLSGIAPLATNGDQLSIYPNPTTGEIFLNISSSADDVKDWSLQIADVLGQTVYTRSSLNYSNDIDLSELPGGVYFITVINKRGRTVVPVTKQ